MLAACRLPTSTSNTPPIDGFRSTATGRGEGACKGGRATAQAGQRGGRLLAADHRRDRHARRAADRSAALTGALRRLALMLRPLVHLDHVGHDCRWLASGQQPSWRRSLPLRGEPTSDRPHQCSWPRQVQAPVGEDVDAEMHLHDVKSVEPKRDEDDQRDRSKCGVKPNRKHPNAPHHAKGHPCGARLRPPPNVCWAGLRARAAPERPWESQRRTAPPQPK
jgi:hypothetical protein